MRNIVLLFVVFVALMGWTEVFASAVVDPRCGDVEDQISASERQLVAKQVAYGELQSSFDERCLGGGYGSPKECEQLADAIVDVKREIRALTKELRELHGFYDRHCSQH